MTDPHAIADFLRRLDLYGVPVKTTGTAVRDAFAHECIESGGFYPETTREPLSRLFEMQLHGIEAIGETEARVLARWIAKARTSV